MRPWPGMILPEPSFGTEKSVQCFVRYTFCKVERYLGSPLKSSSFFKRALFFHKMLVWIFCSKMFTICMFMHVTSHNAHSPAAFCFTSGPQVRRCSYPLSKAGVVRWNDHELVYIYIYLCMVSCWEVLDGWLEWRVVPMAMYLGRLGWHACSRVWHQDEHMHSYIVMCAQVLWCTVTSRPVKCLHACTLPCIFMHART